MIPLKFSIFSERTSMDLVEYLFGTRSRLACASLHRVMIPHYSSKVKRDRASADRGAQFAYYASDAMSGTGVLTCH